MKEKIKLLWEKYKSSTGKQKLILLVSLLLVVAAITSIIILATNVPSVNNNNSLKNGTINTRNNTKNKKQKTRKNSNLNIEISIGDTIDITDSDKYYEWDDVINIPELNKGIYDEQLMYKLNDLYYDSRRNGDILSYCSNDPGNTFDEFISKLETNDAYDFSKISAFLSDCISNKKASYEKINEGIDPESDEYEEPEIEDYYVYIDWENFATYLYQKNTTDENEREFFIKMLKTYFEKNESSIDYKTTYYVTLYPVVLNNKLIYYYITYDSVVSEAASEKEIKKEYQTVKEEFMNKVKKYPNSYIDDIGMYKEYDNYKKCSGKTCVSLNKVLDVSDIYGYFYPEETEEDGIHLEYHSYKVKDLVTGKDYDIYEYIKNNFDDAINKKIKITDVFKKYS